MSNIIPPEFQSWFRYDEQWQVLICLNPLCRSAIPSERLVRHLRDVPIMKHKEYSLFLEAISTVSICKTFDEFSHPLNDSPPIEELIIY